MIHLAPYIDKYNYELNHRLTVGAALAFTAEQFRAVNGYSNEFVVRIYLFIYVLSKVSGLDKSAGIAYIKPYSPSA